MYLGVCKWRCHSEYSLAVRSLCVSSRHRSSFLFYRNAAWNGLFTSGLTSSSKFKAARPCCVRALYNSGRRSGPRGRLVFDSTTSSSSVLCSGATLVLGGPNLEASGVTTGPSLLSKLALSLLVQATTGVKVTFGTM